MFYIIEDNSHRLNEDTLLESYMNGDITLEQYMNEGSVTSAIGDSMLGKKVEITTSELKSKLRTVHDAIDIYFDQCMKNSSKLSWYFRKNVEEYRKEIHGRLDGRIEKGLSKGKFTLNLQLPIPVFGNDNKSRTQSAYQQIVRAAETKLPKEFHIGVGINRGVGFSPKAYFSQVWLTSERFIITDAKK